jgi:hypothetical protein
MSAEEINALYTQISSIKDRIKVIEVVLKDMKENVRSMDDRIFESQVKVIKRVRK